MPLSVASCAKHQIGKLTPVPSPNRGRLYGRIAVEAILSTSHEALLSMVGTDEGRDWAEKPDRSVKRRGV
jgi:hypothetical protein